MPVVIDHLKEYLVWVAVLVIAVTGAPYIKRFIVFVLDELYQIFIQHNPEEHDHQYHS